MAMERQALTTRPLKKQRRQLQPQQLQSNCQFAHVLEATKGPFSPYLCVSSTTKIRRDPAVAENKPANSRGKQSAGKVKFKPRGRERIDLNHNWHPAESSGALCPAVKPSIPQHLLFFLGCVPAGGEGVLGSQPGGPRNREDEARARFTTPAVRTEIRFFQVVPPAAQPEFNKHLN